LPTYRTPASSLAKAAGAGLAVAVGTAILWRFFPEWQFYLCLLMGFGVVETIARFSGNKRGADLQLLAVGIVTVGFLLSRVLLAQRFGISMAEVNALGPSISGILQLRFIPDVVYALLAYLIAWVRFR